MVSPLCILVFGITFVILFPLFDITLVISFIYFWYHKGDVFICILVSLWWYFFYIFGISYVILFICVWYHLGDIIWIYVIYKWRDFGISLVILFMRKSITKVMLFICFWYQLCDIFFRFLYHLGDMFLAFLVSQKWYLFPILHIR